MNGDRESLSRIPRLGRRERIPGNVRQHAESDPREPSKRSVNGSSPLGCARKNPAEKRGVLFLVVWVRSVEVAYVPNRKSVTEVVLFKDEAR